MRTLTRVAYSASRSSLNQETVLPGGRLRTPPIIAHGLAIQSDRHLKIAAHWLYFRDLAAMQSARHAEQGGLADHHVLHEFGWDAQYGLERGFGPPRGPECFQPPREIAAPDGADAEPFPGHCRELLVNRDRRGCGDEAEESGQQGDGGQSHGRLSSSYGANVSLV